MSFTGQPLIPSVENGIIKIAGVTIHSSTILLPNGYVPMQKDILSGTRGTANKKHPGNQIFAQRVRENLNVYANASSRINRSLVVTNVVDSLQCDGMRFIKFDPDIDRFIELSTDQAHAKVGHAIRDQIKSNGAIQLRSFYRKSRSSSLPTTTQSNSTAIMEASTKQLQRRHSTSTAEALNIDGNDDADATCHDTKETERMRKTDHCQPLLSDTITSSSDYNLSSSSLNMISYPQQERGLDIAVEETSLQHAKSSSLEKNQTGFQYIGEQRMRKDMSSAVFDLGQGVEGRMLSNNFAPTPATNKPVLSSSPAMAPLGQRVNGNPFSQPFDTKFGDRFHVSGSSNTRTPSASSCPFAPLPVDSETNFEAQDMKELHDVLHDGYTTPYS